MSTFRIPQPRTRVLVSLSRNAIPKVLINTPIDGGARHAEFSPNRFQRFSKRGVLPALNGKRECRNPCDLPVYPNNLQIDFALRRS